MWPGKKKKKRAREPKTLTKGCFFLSQPRRRAWASWLSFLTTGRSVQALASRETGDPLSPHRLVLTVHPQAELATSHKCLSHEVKRLTEENQGLRAEQPPSSAPRGLEQDEGQEESLPGSLLVRRGTGPSSPRTAKHWPGATGVGDAPRLLCISCVTMANSLNFSKAWFPPLPSGTTPPSQHQHREKMS